MKNFISSGKKKAITFSKSKNINDYLIKVLGGE